MAKGIYKRVKSVWNKGLTKLNDERVMKYSEKNKGRKHSEEEKQKMRKPFSDERKLKLQMLYSIKDKFGKSINHPCYGRKFPESLYPKRAEQTKKLKILNKELWKTSEYRNKIFSNRITPIKDTVPELIIQNLLTLLHKEYYAHKYMNIEHSYQCDILIPVQEGIKQKTIIECDGDYWHNYPIGKEIDKIRTKELIAQGFRVIRLWDSKIRSLTINKFKDILEKCH